MYLLKEKSFTGKTWVKLQHDVDNFNNISNFVLSYDVNPIVAKVLANRQIMLEDVGAFFNPKIKDTMADPYLIKDMEKACNIILKALENNKKVIIVGDYDVDGITSTTIFLKYFSQLNFNVTPYIPDRYKEGYGITIKALENILPMKPDVLVLVDNGSNAINEIKLAKANNIEVIILDHHKVEAVVQEADALVNPHRIDDNSPYNYLCAVGVTFLFLVAFNKLLKEKDFFVNRHLPSIDLMNFLDMVALGTVCDMVPIKGLNRAFVFQGIKFMQKRTNVALKSLADTLNIDKSLDIETLGYVFGPCINAASRMGNANLALRLLLAEEEGLAAILAEELKKLNEIRQKEEHVVINTAVTEIKLDVAKGLNIENIVNSKNKENSKNFIFIGDAKWPLGIVGLIAGRIKENYGMPTCVYSLDNQTGMAVASGRSIDGIDLGNIIIGAKQLGLIEKGGGHQQAVGFTFDITKKDEIYNFINTQIGKKLQNKDNNIKLFVDDVLPINAVNEKLSNSIAQLEPFGVNFKEPQFMISKVKIMKVEQVGKLKDTLSLLLTDGIKFNVKAFCYKCLPGILGDELLKREGEFVDLIVTIKNNFYKGKFYVNLIIKDLG